MSRKNRPVTDKYPLTDIPFNADPRNHVLVRSREKVHWRQKRGTIKEAKVNNVLAENARLSGIVARTASTVLKKLKPYTTRLLMGRVNLRMSIAFRKSMKERGRLDYQSLKGFDFQPEHLLDALYQGLPEISQTTNSLTVTIPLGNEMMVKHSDLVSHYYFELILLHGDPAQPESLRTEGETSKLYTYNKVDPGKCTLSLVLPEGSQPWMVVFKVNSHEGNEMAFHGRHYGMKVVAAG